MKSDASPRPSRTRKKKQAHELQQIGQTLTALTDAQLKQLELPVELNEAVIAARNMRGHEARRRQMQFIGSLMRSVDAEAITRAVESLTAMDRNEVRLFRQAEQWRDQLIQGEDQLIAKLIEQLPSIDCNRLTDLVRQARGDKLDSRTKAASRELFRYLRQLIPQ